MLALRIASQGFIPGGALPIASQGFQPWVIAPAEEVLGGARLRRGREPGDWTPIQDILDEIAREFGPLRERLPEPSDGDALLEVAELVSGRILEASGGSPGDDVGTRRATELSAILANANAAQDAMLAAGDDLRTVNRWRALLLVVILLLVD